MIDNLIFVITNFFNIYFWLVLVRCFLSFVPSIDWNKQPFTALRDTTDLYLNLFRKFIPPINGIDFSPIIAMLALQFMCSLIVMLLMALK